MPFKGTGESVPALLGGHIDTLFSAYPSLSGAVGTKAITLLATNGAKRSAQAPDVPSVAEFIPGFEFAPNIGIYARAGTPQSAMDKIASEVAALVKEPEIIKHSPPRASRPMAPGLRPTRKRAQGRQRPRRQGGEAAGITPQ